MKSNSDFKWRNRVTKGAANEISKNLKKRPSARSGYCDIYYKDEEGVEEILTACTPGKPETNLVRAFIIGYPAHETKGHGTKKANEYLKNNFNLFKNNAGRLSKTYVVKDRMNAKPEDKPFTKEYAVLAKKDESEDKAYKKDNVQANVIALIPTF